MTVPIPFSEVIGRQQGVAARFDRGEATQQELRDALMQLDGAKRVVGDALVRASEANR